MNSQRALEQPAVMQEFLVTVGSWQLQPERVRFKPPRSSTVNSRFRLLSGPDTAKSVQEKVDTILALFYRWPELCAEVMKKIQTARAENKRVKVKQRRAAWCRNKYAARKLARAAGTSSGDNAASPP